MTIPFLIDFTPYEFNDIECRSIDDMVSVSLQQTVPVSNITYNIGSTDNIRIPLQIKNITNNANLEIKFTFDKNIFIINGTDSSVILQPDEIREFNIEPNKTQLNESLRSLLTKITLEIKNILNGTVVTKDISAATLSVSNLAETVNFSS
jgi:hypothetical protein